MKSHLIILVSIVVLGSGCSALTGDVSPEKQFKSQINDMTESDFHVVYDVEANLDGYGSMISGMVNRPEIYKNGDESKFVVEVSGVTAAVYDVFGGSSALCTQGSIFGGVLGSNQSEEDSISCEPIEGSYMETDEITESLEEFKISRDGTKTVADRQCQNYVLEAKEEVNESIESSELANTSVSEYSESRIEICLDSEKGYPAIMKVKTNETSELRDSGTKEVFSIKASEYDTEFDGVEMGVPVDVGTTISCDPFQANITSFDYEGEVKISANEGDNLTREIESGSQISVNLSSEEMVSGSNEVKVFTGEDGPSTSTCYDYSYDYGSDYDYNATSDYQTDYNYSY